MTDAVCIRCGRTAAAGHVQTHRGRVDIRDARGLSRLLAGENAG